MLVCAAILVVLCGQHTHCEELPVSLTDSDTARGEVTAWLEQFLQQHNQDMGELKSLVHAQQKQIEDMLQQLEDMRDQNVAQETRVHELQDSLRQCQASQLKEPVTNNIIKPLFSEDATLDHDSSRKSARSDDPEAWEAVLSQLTSQLTAVTADIQALKNVNSQQVKARGSTYVRWGNAACPNSSQIVYSGVMGGSYYNQAGGAANYLCLPHDPELYDTPVPGHDGVPPGLYGAEYDMREPQHQQNAVCAVCRSPRTSTFMLPAKMSCEAGWVQEFGGYLMAGSANYASISEYVCVDEARGYMEGTGANNDGQLLYYAVTHCGSLPCPPYVNGQLVSCVVCSK